MPANTIDEAKRDPRFQSAAVDGDARVKIVSVARGYPYFGISDNGCGPGKHFVTAELLAPFDGLPAGTPVVLRTADAGARAGATLALDGLRRAGKGRDGTFVYCGAAAASPVSR